MNLFLIIIFLAILLGGTLIAFRFGFAWMLAYGTFINALMFSVGLSQLEIFGTNLMVATLVYSANYYITDLIEEHYGIKKARNFIVVILGTQLGLIGMVTLVLQMTPASSDTLFTSISELVKPWYPVMIISVFSNFILQYIDTGIFKYIKEKTGQKWLWLRNNGSTMITMSLDSFIILPLAIHFAFPDMDSSVLLSLAITSMITKVLIALFDTPFIYLSFYFKPNELKEELKK